MTANLNYRNPVQGKAKNSVHTGILLYIDLHYDAGALKEGVDVRVLSGREKSDDQNIDMACFGAFSSRQSLNTGV